MTITANMPGRFLIFRPRAEFTVRAAIYWENNDDSMMPQGARCAPDGIVVQVVLNATAFGRLKEVKSRPKTDTQIRLWNSDERSDLMVREARRTCDTLSNNWKPVWLLQRSGESGYYGWDVVVLRD